MGRQCLSILRPVRVPLRGRPVEEMFVRSILALLVALTGALGAPGQAAARPIDVHPALAPAWQALTTLRTADGQDIGSYFALIAEATGSA